MHKNNKNFSLFNFLKCFGRLVCLFVCFCCLAGVFLVFRLTHLAGKSKGFGHISCSSTLKYSTLGASFSLIPSFWGSPGAALTPKDWFHTHSTQAQPGPSRAGWVCGGILAVSPPEQLQSSSQKFLAGSHTVYPLLGVPAPSSSQSSRPRYKRAPWYLVVISSGFHSFFPYISFLSLCSSAV